MSRNISLLFITIFILPVIMFLPLSGTAYAQESQGLGEFTVLMDDLIEKISDIESGYSPALAGNIARTRRLEVYSQIWPEIEAMAVNASGRTDANSSRLLDLYESQQTIDPTDDDYLAVLEELYVRGIIVQCQMRNIGPDTVTQYIRRESSTFVANRGNFSHPDFDESTLIVRDHVQIYFCGFGLIVLNNMAGGAEYAIQIYNESTDLKGYFGNQLVFRGVDRDLDGLSMLEAVLFDESVSPAVAEYYYSVIAGKLVGPAGEFGNVINPTDEWKTAIAGWVYDYITIPERLESRETLEFYGVDFEGTSLGPESLLGLLGPAGMDKISELLSSSYFMENMSGLEALRWFDLYAYAEEAGELFAIAEPLMAHNDFTLAVLAKEAFDADARYYGEPYSDSRRERLRANMPYLVDLLDRALAHPGVDYLSSTAWLDIFAEGTLTDQLYGCIPMVSQVVASDYARLVEGESVSLPEGEVEVLSYFIPMNTEFFTESSDAVRGFLDAELDSGAVNPFRIWTYVRYLEAARSAGIVLDEDWQSTLVRLKSYIDSATALIRADELSEKIDSLMFE